MSSFIRPTLSEIVTRVQADFVSRLEITGALLRRSVAAVLARVLAGAVHMLYGNLDFIARQLFADQAEAAYLLRKASVYGFAPEAAAFATGAVPCTGTNGSVIPAGSVLVRADGVTYTVAADVTVSSGVATVQVIADVAAENGNCDSGTSLSFQSPIAGVDSTATVGTDGLGGGTDPEDVETAFRSRFLEFMRTPPQGGADADYSIWAKEVAGVTRVWVFPLQMGAGTVVVYFMRDNDSGSPIPDSGEVAAVQTAINARRPVTATVTVAAPIADPLNLTLHIVPDTTATRAAVVAEITDLLSREAAPGVTLPLSNIRTALGIAPGVLDYTLATPAADVTHSTGHIATVGTFTWT